MKNKVLKLAKRLGKFSVEEVSPIISADENQLEEILQELLSEKSILKRADSTYFYQEKSKKKTSELPLFFEFRTKEELDMIIKCFCADIVSTKACFVTNLNDNIIFKFNKYFRKIIYEKQKEKLEKLYYLNPQIARMRRFFGVAAYFYIYNNKLYVSENILQSSEEKGNFTKNEVIYFKTVYSKLTRRICQHQMSQALYYYVAESLWRDAKGFDKLVDDLRQLLTA